MILCRVRVTLAPDAKRRTVSVKTVEKGNAENEKTLYSNVARV